MTFSTISGTTNSGVSLSGQGGFVLDAAGMYVVTLMFRPDTNVAANGDACSLILGRWDGSAWVDLQSSERTSIAARNSVHQTYTISTPANARWRFSIATGLGLGFTVSTSPIYSYISVFKVG